MADEAFALSPISARAAQPSEADYEAIRDAFMETSRGRWFLGEYAKRNRNADTSMVLDAVARIEDALAAQRQPPPDNKLPEALAAIRGAVDQAAGMATTALDSLAIEDSLAPVRKGVRIIKEISWRWREIGADPRICDLIDSQVGAIEASCGQMSEIDPRPDVNAAFELIRDRIDGFSDDAGEAAAPAKAEATPAAMDPVAEQAVEQPVAAAAIARDPVVAEPEPALDEAPSQMAFAALAEIAVAAEAALEAQQPDEIESRFVEPETPGPEAVVAEAIVPQAIAAETLQPDLPVDVQVSVVEAAEETSAAAEAEDEAILDMVALEMAAPDETGDEDYFSAIDEGDIEAPEPVIAGMAVADETRFLEPEAAPAPPLQPSVQAPLAPTSASAVQPSLGSTLLARGLLEQHRAPMTDPLAPIRRMSQAERIAFFS
jgi:hypothetical protein